jgi:hypothetical protein
MGNKEILIYIGTAASIILAPHIANRGGWRLLVAFLFLVIVYQISIDYLL